jgi:hypothetical protein
MFRAPPEGPTVEVHVEGVALRVPAGTSAAAAALLAGLGHTRTHPLSGEPRAPYCMMGVCFECLMLIDGVPSRQACLVPVRAGMAIARQLGPRGLE